MTPDEVAAILHRAGYVLYLRSPKLIVAEQKLPDRPGIMRRLSFRPDNGLSLAPAVAPIPWLGIAWWASFSPTDRIYKPDHEIGQSPRLERTEQVADWLLAIATIPFEATARRA